MKLMHVRCACGKVFNQAYQKIRDQAEIAIRERILALIELGFHEQDAVDYLYENQLDLKPVMDKLGLKRRCCRLTFMETIVIPFPRPASEIAQRIKKIIPEMRKVKRSDEVIAEFNRDLSGTNLEESDSDSDESDTEVPTFEQSVKLDHVKGNDVSYDLEYVGAGKFIQVLKASRLPSGERVRTYKAL